MTERPTPAMTHTDLETVAKNCERQGLAGLAVILRCSSQDWEAEVKRLRDLAKTALVDWLSPRPLAELEKSWPAMKAIQDYFNALERDAARAARADSGGTKTEELAQ